MYDVPQQQALILPPPSSSPIQTSKYFTLTLAQSQAQETPRPLGSCSFPIHFPVSVSCIQTKKSPLPDRPRPLEILKGLRLSGTYGGRDPDNTFLAHLKTRGTRVRRIELSGYNEMDDLRRLIECAPGLTWLDVGRKGGVHAVHAAAREQENIRYGTGATMTASNTLEWAMLLSELPDLMTFHGIRLFFEVSGTASLPGVTATTRSTHISMADRSRIRKNDEVAGLLSWKCPKLRRVDHWEEGSGKVIVLVRDHEKEKVRWEVRRTKF